MRSAYFDDSDDSELVLGNENNDTREMNHSKRLNSAQNALAVDFPQIIEVLWDRTPISSLFTIRSDDACYPLVLEVQHSKILLSLLHNTRSSIDSNNVEFGAELTVTSGIGTKLRNSESSPFGFVITNNSLKILQAQLEHSTSLLSLCNRIYSPCSLTIPITHRNKTENESIRASSEASMTLVQNMSKSLRLGRDFSLRTLFRIMGTGHTNNLGPLNSTLSGSIRFESIFPKVTILLHRIAPIAILSTPFAVRLMKSSSNLEMDASRLSKDEGSPRLPRNTSFKDIFSLPKMGYLSMNQTRKIIFILENDDAIARVPVVGVWVCLQPMGSLSFEGYLRHPFVWGACIRYSCSEHLTKRVLLEGKVFLLTLLIGSEIFFFEVQAFGDSLCNNLLTSDSLSSPEAFAHLDFTVDLNLNNDDSESQSEPILCRFKPIRRNEPLTPTQVCLNEGILAGSNSPQIVNGNGMAKIQYANNLSRPLTTSIYPSSDLLSNCNGPSERSELNSSNLLEMSTPAPRLRIPLPAAPTPSPKATVIDRAGSNIKKSSEDAPEYTTEVHSPSQSNHGNGQSHSHGSSVEFDRVDTSGVHNSAQAMIIESQQLQIDALKREVQELKMFISKIYAEGMKSSSSPLPPSPAPPPQEFQHYNPPQSQLLTHRFQQQQVPQMPQFQPQLLQQQQQQQPQGERVLKQTQKQEQSTCQQIPPIEDEQANRRGLPEESPSIERSSDTLKKSSLQRMQPNGNRTNSHFEERRSIAERSSTDSFAEVKKATLTISEGLNNGLTSEDNDMESTFIDDMTEDDIDEDISLLDGNEEIRQILASRRHIDHRHNQHLSASMNSNEAHTPHSSQHFWYPRAGRSKTSFEVEESTTIFESESILAIQSKYLKGSS